MGAKRVPQGHPKTYQFHVTELQLNSEERIEMSCCEQNGPVLHHGKLT